MYNLLIEHFELLRVTAMHIYINRNANGRNEWLSINADNTVVNVAKMLQEELIPSTIEIISTNTSVLFNWCCRSKTLLLQSAAGRVTFT